MTHEGHRAARTPQVVPESMFSSPALKQPRVVVMRGAAHDTSPPCWRAAPASSGGAPTTMAGVSSLLVAKTKATTMLSTWLSTWPV